MKKQSLLMAFCLIIAAAAQNACKKSSDCIEQSRISTNPCTKEWNPVCGCDNVTYGNPCQAANAGVLRTVSGECVR